MSTCLGTSLRDACGRAARKARRQGGKPRRTRFAPPLFSFWQPQRAVKGRIARVVFGHESWITAQTEPKWDELRDAAASLRTGEHPVRPFHWAIEFPEVFARESGGFDAIVGNPPFLGGKNISTTFGDAYSWWLDTNHFGGTRSADLRSVDDQPRACS